MSTADYYKGGIIMDAMYSNRFSVAVSADEAFITFAQIVPIQDDKGEVTSEAVAEKKNIILSLSMAKRLEQMIHELLEKKEVDENATEG